MCEVRMRQIPIHQQILKRIELVSRLKGNSNLTCVNFSSAESSAHVFFLAQEIV